MQCGAESRAYEASIGEQGVRSGDKRVVSGLVACAADAGAGVSHETPAGPWADNTWALNSNAESRACEAAIRRRGAAS